MNKIDKVSRRKNWPAIKYFCKYVISMAGATIKDVEKVYVQGKEFEHVMNKNTYAHPSVIYETIICCPDLPKDEIQRLMDVNGPLGSFKNKIPVENYRYYFGQNSYFNGNENLIFDILYPLGYVDETFTKLGDGEGQSAEDINSKSCEWLLPYLGRFRVNPLDQSWRHVSFYFQYLSLLPNTLEKYDDDKHGEKLIWLCWLEWAHKNQKLCEPNVLKLAKHIRAYFLSNKVKPVVKSTYKSVIKARYSEYLESHAPGGRLHGLIKFSSAKQLKEVIPLLDENTRYPYDGTPDDKTLKQIPLATQSVSGATIHRLWWSGVTFEDIEVIDSKTLYVSVPIGLSLNMAVNGANCITFDVSNLKEKLEKGVNRPVKGDKLQDKDDAKQVKNIWCIEPTVGAPQYLVNNMSGVIRYGENKKLDKIYDSESEPAIYLGKMMAKHHSELLKGSVSEKLGFKFKVGVDKY